MPRAESDRSGTCAPVSVIIPCYRCADTLTRAVASVWTQTWRPAELILVNDASPDDGATQRAIESVRDSAPAGPAVKTLLLQRNAGPAGARNAGWEQVTQQYVAFLDADDAWHPRKLEIQIAWMQAHPEATLTGTLTRVIDGTEEWPSAVQEPDVRELRKRDMLLANPLPTRSVVLRAEVRQRFVAEKRYSEDYLLWVSIQAAGHRIFLLQAPLACSFKRDFGEAGLSADLWKMHREVLDSYRRLHADRCIGGATRALLGIMAWIKFCRRLLLTWKMRADRRPGVPEPAADQSKAWLEGSVPAKERER